MKILDLLLTHWKVTGLVALLILASTSTAIAIDQWKDRIAAEAVAAERLADFQAADSARQLLANELANRDSTFRADSIRLARLEREADSLIAVAETSVREASTRAVEAGEDVRATLDSLTVTETLEDAHRLALVARTQLGEHLSADRETMAAVEDERRASDDLTASLREQVSLWGTRYESERNLRLATERALDEARLSLEAQIEAGRRSWHDHTLVKAAGIGLAFYAGYSLGTR